VSDKPLDLDKHRGMAEQKATDIRRILADVKNNAKDLRDRQGILENQLLSVPAASWPEAAAKARYVLNLYAAGAGSGRQPSSRFGCSRTCGLCPAFQRELNYSGSYGL
jgi:hypothetical protein